MARRKGKSGQQVVVKSASNTALTLTIPVLKPRNLLAIHPLLKKSTVHSAAQGRNKRGRDSALEMQEDLKEALNRRCAGDDKGGDGGGSP